MRYRLTIFVVVKFANQRRDTLVIICVLFVKKIFKNRTHRHKLNNWCKKVEKNQQWSWMVTTYMSFQITWDLQLFILQWQIVILKDVAGFLGFLVNMHMSILRGRYSRSIFRGEYSLDVYRGEYPWIFSGVNIFSIFPFIKIFY